MPITITGRGLQNLANRSDNYTGDIDYVIALAKLHGCDTTEYSITARDMGHLRDLIAQLDTGYHSISWCDYGDHFADTDETWHLDCMDLGRQTLDHICWNCAESITGHQLLVMLS